MQRLYYVEAHTDNATLAEDFLANDLAELAKFVQEKFAYYDGNDDTSKIDCSYIKFEYDKVENEDFEDITEEANKYV